ncbi:1370_t:CDS:2, partial [Gigaspora margarita]
ITPDLPTSQITTNLLASPLQTPSLPTTSSLLVGRSTTIVISSASISLDNLQRARTHAATNTVWIRIANNNANTSRFILGSTNFANASKFTTSQITPDLPTS